MSFGGSSGNNYHGGHVGSLQPSPNCSYSGHANDESDRGKPGMLEVVAGLSRDCFIIPLACVDRFLPAGLTVSPSKSFSGETDIGVFSIH